MGQHVRIAVLVGMAALSASCGRKPTPLPEPVVQRTPERPRTALPLASKDAYEADGTIKGSATRVDWLEVPAAFKRSDKLSFGAHEVYEAEGLPFARMCDFLGKRMFTGKVDLDIDRAFYHAVMPLDMNEKSARLNVSLIQRGGRMTLDIERLTPRDAAPLSDEAARKLLAKDQERAQ